MSTTKTNRALKLPDDIESLKAHIAHLGPQLAVRDAELAACDEAIASLHEQIRLMLARRFGASSERVADGQLGLLNEAEELAAADDENAHEVDGGHDVEIAAHTRRRRGKRSPLPEHLPRALLQYLPRRPIDSGDEKLRLHILVPGPELAGVQQGAGPARQHHLLGRRGEQGDRGGRPER